MKKNPMAKIMAILALFGIIVWIIWTWLLVIFSWGQTSNHQQQLSEEELQELLNNLEQSNSWTTNSWSLEINITEQEIK